MTLQTKKFDWSTKEKGIFLVLTGIGIITFVVSLFYTHERAWAAYLVGYYFWLCVALGGIFFSVLQFIAGASWSVTVRRVAESFLGYIPVAVVLFGVLLFGVHTLFEWTHHHVVAADPLLTAKTPYLNVPFFIIRSLALFVLVFFLGGRVIKNSIAQDENGDVAYTFKNRKLAPVFILAFAWMFSFVSIDLMQSLSPHWFSTIFGVYCFSGLLTSSLAMITLLVIWLRKKGVLDTYVSSDHLHDLGKLMFAFMVFWAYIAISQFLLIWYGNLPEETFYYLDRFKGGWSGVSLALILFKFVIPFFLLVARPFKRSEGWLVFMVLWFMAAQWLDIYWLVYPTFFKEGPVFGLPEIGIFLGFAGLFFLSAGYFLSRINPVAIKDPLLHEALHHHQ
ncbi:MAG: hypothetical protein A3G32_02755 [Deltaproteobacteria bacterium RIFCSPLOWO2_12_FULL_40_28]|nr:MAG: hypothetical protein A3C45_00135 [Deltaproteobacteria bacterium RIFCSPHIGHO2_02_FULL_40_28]OGQ20037.1 MAG: hypothetical protein A3E27_02800 [Deltaproteobacteria bacterium RIFCSPHIGHO2_12_FULL_40_32]OGQ40604.1 MAG: hypothetical protein A3I69_10225 [Deltaproteobacteria bacterium RIFCSPLOWO2_02_FULL_40_36]OGQ54273.1 MAG: hypothetical protein A3G32_02755 [Deltaproteobacteria bacterium RIFCSPLOWO2_12_FULL_40_28]